MSALTGTCEKDGCFSIILFIMGSVLPTAGSTEDLEVLVKARYADCHSQSDAFSVEELHQRLQNK